jgi:molybdopterin molybdotransferase
LAKLLPYETAIALALGDVTPLPAETVSLEEALGRVLAEDLVAPRPLPPFSHSAMDGWAVASGTLAGEPPFELAARGESRAGSAAGPLPVGTACRIFTGAPLPEGADAVVIQENAEQRGDRVLLRVGARPGDNVRRAGADLAAGAVAAPRGTRLGPGGIGLCAAVDRPRVAVARRPVVVVLPTGDELRPPGSDAADAASIPESNSYAVAAMARRAGAVAHIWPACADEPEETAASIGRALDQSDLCITIGGASVGDHDLVRPALERLGAEIAFWGVAIKPGKPTALCRRGAARALCLPGNPASAALAFVLFGLPLLRAMQGDRQPLVRRALLPVAGRHQRRPGREEYLRARLELREGVEHAVLAGGQSSGAVQSFAAADALAVLAADLARVDDGDRLPVIRLSDVWGP